MLNLFLKLRFSSLAIDEIRSLPALLAVMVFIAPDTARPYGQDEPARG